MTKKNRTNKNNKSKASKKTKIIKRRVFKRRNYKPRRNFRTFNNRFQYRTTNHALTRGFSMRNPDTRGRGDVRVRRTEYLTPAVIGAGDDKGPIRLISKDKDGAFTSLMNVAVNVGSRLVFPWLSNLAQSFEGWIMNKLKLNYNPTCPTTTTGSVVVAPIYGQESVPTNISDLMQRPGARVFSPYQKGTMEVPAYRFKTRRQYYMSNPDGSYPEGGVESDYQPVRLVAGWSGPASNAGSEIGNFQVEYDATLKNTKTSDSTFSGASAIGVVTHMYGDTTTAMASWAGNLSNYVTATLGTVNNVQLSVKLVKQARLTFQVSCNYVGLSLSHSVVKPSFTVSVGSSSETYYSTTSGGTNGPISYDFVVQATNNTDTEGYMIFSMVKSYATGSSVSVPMSLRYDALTSDQKKNYMRNDLLNEVKEQMQRDLPRLLSNHLAEIEEEEDSVSSDGDEKKLDLIPSKSHKIRSKTTEEGDLP